MIQRLGRAAVLGAALTMMLSVGTTVAHGGREVGEYSFTVGFLDEPVEGLEETLKAEVIFNDQRRDLPISPAFDDPGAYRSVFFPTAAGPYTFRVFGTIEGTEIDESFTSVIDDFNEVQDVTGGQFPVVLPAAGDTARDATAGADAAGTATLALVVGGAGLLAGLVALGLTLARRRG